MRGRGINYDVGFATAAARAAGRSSREPFDPAVVAREMRVIREDLHCTAVRITGGDPERLAVAATHAAAAGLEVWIAPFTCDITADELLDVIVRCADHGERLRRDGAEVVVATGSEISLFTDGFLPGETAAERLALLTRPERLREALPALPGRVNAFLGRAVAAVRERFGGRVTYCSLPVERVDWTPFDIIASDAGYRSAATAPTYRDTVRAFVAQGRALGKPVAVTEFGCATFRGARTWARAPTRSSSGAPTAPRPPSAASTCATSRSRSPTCANSSTSWTRRASTAPSGTPSPAATSPTAPTRARISTSPAGAW